MIPEFVRAWNENHEELEEYLRITPQNMYSEYNILVELLFNRCINPYLSKIGKNTFDTNDMTEIDYGDYQGTLIFILHEDSYQPSTNQHVYTHNYYGSCSGCDTLMGIHHYEDGLPNEEQINDYMMLLLQLLQHCHMFDDSIPGYELNGYRIIPK